MLQNVSKNKVILFLFLTQILLLLTNMNLRSETETGFEYLDNGWQYCFGDKIDLEHKAGKFVINDNFIDWKKANYDNPPDNTIDSKYAWFKIKLPNTIYKNPIIYFERFICRQQFEIYFDSNMIYKSGKFEDSFFNWYDIVKHHTVYLPPNSQGKYLYIRFYSDRTQYTGINFRKKIVLGNYTTLLERYNVYSLLQIIAGVLLIATSIFSFYIFFLRRKNRNLLTLHFGLVNFDVGVYVLFFNYFVIKAFNEIPIVWWYIASLSYYLFPVFVWSFVEKTIGTGKNKLINLCWKFYLLYGIVAVLLDVSHIVPYFDMDNDFFMGVLALGILIVGIELFKDAAKGNKEAKLISYGFIAFAISGIIDLLNSFRIIYLEIDVFVFGLIVFTMFIGIIIEQRFTDSHNKLQKYSKDLEVLNQELDIKVDERTKELVEKNKQIENQNFELESLINHLQRNNDLISRQNSELETLNSNLAEKNSQISKNLVEKEALNKQLAEVNNTKDKFFSIIAHDLRNPLQALLLSSDMLVRYGDKYDIEKLRKKSADIFKASRSLTDLIENLLQWARTQTDSMSYEPDNYNLLNLVQKSYEPIATNAEKKQIEVIIDIPRNIFINVDENMMSSVFRNLVSNAIKFSASGSKIRIHSKGLLNSDANNFVDINVIDSGIGISKARIDNIFDVGHTFSTPGSHGERGTGLGLILCKEFVERNGGEIRVESAENSGSNFIVSIPAIK